jgi:RNA polymerase sigma-70 factor (ECF subfamily)
LVENETEQEELGQEIFVKIYQSLPSFRFQSNLATWITRIAYNTCLNYLRKKKTPLYEDQITAISLGESETENRNHGIEGVSSRSVLQDETLFKKEISGFLHREIKALPVQYRKIITFYHLDNMSYKEIAEVINIPEGTVKSYMFRARKILKDRLTCRPACIAVRSWQLINSSMRNAVLNQNMNFRWILKTLLLKGFWQQKVSGFYSEPTRCCS